MIKLRAVRNPNLPLRFVLPVTTLSVLSIALLEWRGLDNLEHPESKKISCISCHSDKKTLDAMADKAGDPLYLVHSGQLTLPELKRLTGAQTYPPGSKTK